MWLTKQDITVSMNPKGSPRYNGAQESFFGRLNVEFGDFGQFDIYAELLEELYFAANLLHQHPHQDEAKDVARTIPREVGDAPVGLIHRLSVSPAPPHPPNRGLSRPRCA